MLYNSSMKKKLLYFVTSLCLIFSITVPVSAHSESLGTIGQNRATEEINASAVDDSAGRPARLETYKKGLKETLTETVKTRIAGRCVAAQAILKAKIDNNLKTTSARTIAYEKIVNDLQKVVTAATAKDVDTTDLEANITVLQTKIAAFKTANTTFQQALTDVGALDCKTDPTAFKAALNTARVNQAAVLTSAKDIRTYVKDTVKVTLQALKTELNS